MDLWIRSQDKSNIVKVNSQFGLKFDDNKTVIANYIPDFSDNYDGSYDVLGTYKTKEKALEVLDEILEFDIEHNPNIKVNCYAYSLIRVIYEMPKE